mmetsp:Transcript_2460/g.4447  ORF Transcript_2460/g.4447 Transcript_2460/m.4447 type:complete len:223 (-) Transcript_2460:1034-1702(-)
MLKGMFFILVGLYFGSIHSIVTVTFVMHVVKIIRGTCAVAKATNNDTIVVHIDKSVCSMGVRTFQDRFNDSKMNATLVIALVTTSVGVTRKGGNHGTRIVSQHLQNVVIVPNQAHGAAGSGQNGLMTQYDDTLPILLRFLQGSPKPLQLRFVHASIKCNKSLFISHEALRRILIFRKIGVVFGQKLLGKFSFHRAILTSPHHRNIVSIKDHKSQLRPIVLFH